MWCSRALLVAVLLACPLANAGDDSDGALDDRRGLLQPVLVGETDYRRYGASALGSQGFALTRLRAGLDARPLPWFRAFAFSEWSRGAPFILDAFVEVRPTPSLRLSLGLSRTPLFPSLHDEVIQALPIPELSVTTRAFTPGRDVGAQLTFAPEALPLQTFLRVGNGSPQALLNTNPSVALDARLDFLAGRYRPGRSSALVGLLVGAGVHWQNAAERTGISGSLPGGYVFFAGPTVEGPRLVAEGHLMLGLGPVRLFVESAAAWESLPQAQAGTGFEGPHVETRGFSAELSWVIRGAPRFDRQWPAMPSAPDLAPGPPSPDSAPASRPPRAPVAQVWTGGALEVAARVERLHFGMSSPSVQPQGVTGAATALRWWVTSFFGVGPAAYYLIRDTPEPLVQARNDTWLFLARATVWIR